jgi:hypothetical protein
MDAGAFDENLDSHLERLSKEKLSELAEIVVERDQSRDGIGRRPSVNLLSP